MTIGERIEYGIKHGRITSVSDTSAQRKGSSSKKKEGEVHTVGKIEGPMQMSQYSPNYYPPPHGYYPYQVNNTSMQYSPYVGQRVRPQTNQGFQPRQQQQTNTPRQENNRMTNRPQFDPIPMTYTELLPQLIQNHQLTPKPIRPIQPPYPWWYDPNARCDYHAGAVGHSTENCTALKFKVQELVKSGWLNFKKEEGPNVNNNPLPNHQVNVVECSDIELKTKIANINISAKQLFEVLLENKCITIEHSSSGLDCEEYDDNLTCLFHAGAKGHSLAKCSGFHKKIQELIDIKVLTVIQSHRSRQDPEICTVEGSLSKEDVGVSFKRKPLTVTYQEKPNPKAITIQVPAPFAYKNSKAVPWSYEYKVTIDSKVPTIPINNITGVGGRTRSGKCYTPNQLMTQCIDKGKEKLGQAKADAENDNSPKQVIIMNSSKTKSPVSEEDAQEFLRIVKQSEYKVVDQLSRTPAKISILSLLLSSEVHRNMIMDVLNQAYVPKDITSDSLDSIVGNITACNSITFTDDEMPPEGTGHTKALHISVKCKNFLIAKVLVDNGSSLNIMPKSTLEKLPVDASHMRPSTVIVRAFDGARSQVVGDIEIPIRVGPCTFDVTFQVMDINSAYSFLLGCPWIHSAGAVPSTLHQKLKFAIGKSLVIVSCQEDIFVSRPASMPYVEAAEEAFEKEKKKRSIECGSKKKRSI